MSSQTKNRVLFVDFDGFTWIFSRRTASWTRLSTSGIGDDEVTIKHFSKLVANSITSLCGTRVIAFAGARSAYNGVEASNETWLFSGASEKWTALTITTEVPRARFGHEAISHYRTESSCQCKESLIVFGGKDAYKKLLHDMWELQCVDDRNEASAKYRWVELKTNLRPLKEYKLNRLTPFSVNNTHIFWLIDDNQRAWIFDLKTERWSSMLINIVFSNNETISMLGSAGKFDTIGNVYVRRHRLFIFLVSPSLMGVYNVEQNRFQFINVEIYGNMQTTTFVAKMMTLRKTLLLSSSKSKTDHGIALWELEINHLLEAVESNCSDSTLLFRKIAFVERYPRLQWDSKIIGITDTVWYLMQESQQKVAI